MDELRDELLKTLSFMEPMSLEYILLDFDKDFLEKNPNLTTEDLFKVLQKLKKEKLVTSKKSDGQIYWVKKFPKKPWYKRLIFSPFK
jgi:hypothetical protein